MSDSDSLVSQQAALQALISGGCIGGMVTLSHGISKGAPIGIGVGLLLGLGLEYVVDKKRTEESVKISMNRLLHALNPLSPDTSSAYKYISSALVTTLSVSLALGGFAQVGNWMPTRAIDIVRLARPWVPVIAPVAAPVAPDLGLNAPDADLGGHLPSAPGSDVLPGINLPDGGVPELPAMPDYKDFPVISGQTILGLLQMGLALSRPAEDRQAKQIALDVMYQMLQNTDLIRTLSDVALQDQRDRIQIITRLMNEFFDAVSNVFATVLPGVNTANHNVVIVQGNDELSYAMVSPVQGQTQVAVPLLKLPQETWLTLDAVARDEGFDPVRILRDPQNAPQAPHTPLQRQSLTMSVGRSDASSLAGTDLIIQQELGMTPRDATMGASFVGTLFRRLGTVTIGVVYSVVGFRLESNTQVVVILYNPDADEMFVEMTANLEELEIYGDPPADDLGIFEKDPDWADLNTLDHVTWDEDRLQRPGQPFPDLGQVVGLSHDECFVTLMDGEEPRRVFQVPRDYIRPVLPGSVQQGNQPADEDDEEMKHDDQGNPRPPGRGGQGGQGQGGPADQESEFQFSSNPTESDEPYTESDAVDAADVDSNPPDMGDQLSDDLPKTKGKGQDDAVIAIGGALSSRIGARLLAKPITDYGPSDIGALTKGVQAESQQVQARQSIADAFREKPQADPPDLEGWQDEQILDDWVVGDEAAIVEDTMLFEQSMIPNVAVEDIAGLGGLGSEMLGGPLMGAGLSMYSMLGQMDEADDLRNRGQPQELVNYVDDEGNIIPKPDTPREDYGQLAWDNINWWAAMGDD